MADNQAYITAGLPVDRDGSFPTGDNQAYITAGLRKLVEAAGGTTDELTGTIAATAAESADISLTRGLLAAAVATAGESGDIAMTRGLAGAAVATTGGSATLTTGVATQLEGTIAAQAAAAGEVFRTASYRIYRGAGSLADVDWENAVGVVVPGNPAPSLTGLGHSANTRYTYAVRPVLDGLEAPDLSCVVEFETDAVGGWIGNRPEPIEVLEATPAAGGQVILQWTYRTAYGSAAPDEFCIYYGHCSDITPGLPDAVETYTADGRYTKALALTGGETYYFAVTTRSGEGVESHISRIIGPILAQATAPPTPTVYASVTLQ